MNWQIRRSEVHILFCKFEGMSAFDLSVRLYLCMFFCVSVCMRVCTRVHIYVILVEVMSQLRHSSCNFLCTGQQ